MFSLLKRQLKRLGLEEGTVPASLEEWQQLLEHVSNTYIEADRNRKMVERSLALSSQEMQELYENLERVSESQLQAEKEQTRQIIDHALDAIVSMDAQGNIITWNPQAEKIFGWNQEEVLGQLLADRIVPPEYRKAHEERLQCFISTGTGPLLKVLNQRLEATALHRNGLEFPIELTIIPLEKDDSYVFCSFIRDITDRKKAEAALTLSEQSIRELYQTTSIPGGTFLQRVSALLEMGCQRFNLPVGLLTKGNGDTLQIVGLFPPNGPFAIGSCVPLCESVCQAPLTTNEPVAYEHAGMSEWKTHPGYVSLKLEAYLGTPVNVSSQTYGTLCFVSPEPYPGKFTEGDKDFLKLMAQWVEGELERQRAQEALENSEERFRQLAENIPEVFWLIHSSLQQVIYVSPTFETVWGRSVTALYDKAELWFEAIHPNDRQRIERAFTQKVLIGKFDEEYQIVRPDGSIRFIRDRGFPICDEQGNVLRIAGIAQDITERKQLEASILQLNTELEERVQQRTAELESKNAELERFTYTVSHDLKSPLVTIQGFLGLVEQDACAGDTARLQDDLHRICGATTKMQRLLDELLELSRIGRVVNQPEVVAMSDIVQEAVKRVAGTIAARKVQMDIAPELPVVFGDHVRLVEVVQNLLDNGVKFMGGQPKPRIEIGMRQEGEEAVMFVRDNGIGIKPQYHKHIFGLFERLNAQAEGTGIGLAIVKRVIEVQGGRIWVESEGQGQGSTFCWTIPREEGSSCEEA